MPILAAAILTSVVFGMMHGTVIWFLYTFLFGMILIWVFERFHSLTASILLHVAYNLSGMALALIPENAGIFVLVLFVMSVFGIGIAYKEVVRVTETMDGCEEAER